MEQLHWIPIVLSVAALILSIVSFLRSYSVSLIQAAHSLHSTLFEDLEDYKLIYKFWRTQDYYFDSASRGAEGNFVGSVDEARVDRFLERINFTCMWLLRLNPRDEELLFKKYIERVYTSDFFQKYFSFLKEASSVATSGVFFPYITNMRVIVWA